jgi:TRAP transporter TAXI family solute receptor
MKKILKILGSWLLCAAILTPVSTLAGEQILIGTGSKDGVYYYAGKAICHTVSKAVEGISCESLPTAGSLYNLINVRQGGLDIGVCQSDWQYQAVKRSGPFEFMDGAFDNLRALFSLHSEPFTLVVRRDAGISNLDGILGRRVNIGNPGSGQRATMEVVMEAKGWVKKDFQLVEELNASEQSFALCNNRIQAMVYTVGHPNESVAKAVRLCNAIIVPAEGPVIDKLVADNPYYAYATIPGDLYTGVDDPVRTFGVKATVVVSSDMSEETAYQIVKAVFDNLDRFRKLHPAFNVLRPQQMVKDGISAPLHDGAVKYYKEKGLM